MLVLFTPQRTQLGSRDTSFKSVGVIVLTRSKERFQLGDLAVQPPGIWSCPMQVSCDIVDPAAIETILAVDLIV